MSGADASPDDAVDAPAASELASFIDSLDDSQIQELNAAADAYAAANPDDAAPPPAEGEDPDTLPAPPPGEEEDPSLETPEEEADEPAPEDLAAISTNASIDVEDAATAIAAMQEIADSDSDSAPAVAKLVALAGKLEASVQKSAALVDKAITKEDVQAAAQAGIDCRCFLEAIQALQVAASSMGQKVEAPGMTPQDHPALKAWSAKVLGKAPAPMAG